MTAKKKKKILTSDELAERAEKFLKGKELNPNAGRLFDQAIRKAAKPHGSK